MKNIFSPLRIVDIEDSGNNGIIYKALDWGRSRALKVMYGFSVPLGVLDGKAKIEFERTKLLEGIEGIPKAYKLYSPLDSDGHNFVPFTAAGFDLEKAKSQIMRQRDAFEFDSENDLILGGAFTMTYMDVFSKLPREPKDLDYALPKKFFDKLEYIADEMLKKGLSLPPESDFCFDKNLEPIVLDFGNCLSFDNLKISGMSESFANTYVKQKNNSTIYFLKDQYSRK